MSDPAVLVDSNTLSDNVQSFELSQPFITVSVFKYRQLTIIINEMMSY